MKMNKNMFIGGEIKIKLLIAFSLILSGVVARVAFFNMLPNTPHLYLNLNGVTQPLFMLDLFFIVAVIAVLSGLLLGGYFSFVIPIIVMGITDVILGNSFIFMFTWSGFALIGVFAYLLKKKNMFRLKKIPTIIGTSILAVLVYDLWTNFGCWLGWYPHTVSGLSMCFTLALPFTLWHVLSTTVAVTLVVIPVLYLKEHKIVKTDFKVLPFENKTTIIAVSALMIFSVLAVLI